MSRALGEPARPRSVGGRTWRKSSHSAADSYCVELALMSDGTIGVRDSKAPDRGALVIATEQAARFLGRAMEGAFDLRA
ncbi:DUF397 domain-containing protein [Actinomadura montaniterrae]|uniref:DUF397 domain-containing protein n=1 Tax=Actinomadura montaniterrae TaxID=1803903 RepID=A0A6L3VVF3_9ACTN|nr:DUF397 domain-containing protein [Actinomadura montaniterrae]KAB2374187.1 DUF397 domain-containing protein [Actinomadura montaniterrae]